MDGLSTTESLIKCSINDEDISDPLMDFCPHTISRINMSYNREKPKIQREHGEIYHRTHGVTSDQTDEISPTFTTMLRRIPGAVIFSTD